MATTPQPPPKPPGVPPPPPTGNHPAVVAKQGEAAKVDKVSGYRPTIGVKGEAIDDGERDPDTIAEEQRKRSDEMQSEGMAKWIEAHDERKGEHAEARKQVAGAAQAKLESHKAT